MIQAKIVNKIKFPEINLQDSLEWIAKNIIITDIVMGIRNQRAITGGSLPRNSPDTLARKAKAGHGSQSLIDTGLLLSSFYYEKRGKNKVVISIEEPRRDAARGLQYGFRTRRYNFFGISKAASDAAMEYTDAKIKELTSGKRG